MVREIIIKIVNKRDAWNPVLVYRHRHSTLSSYVSFFSQVADTHNNKRQQQQPPAASLLLLWLTFHSFTCVVNRAPYSTQIPFRTQTRCIRTTGGESQEKNTYRDGLIFKNKDYQVHFVFFIGHRRSFYLPIQTSRPQRTIEMLINTSIKNESIIAYLQ